MPRPTPFHSRTSQLCTSLFWKDWAGYHAVRSYDICHEPEYAATTNPNHAGAMFPTDCTACHSTRAWQPAQFDHDGLYFRINSGKHRGKWEPDCSACHENPSNYAEFSCFSCHDPTQAEMDDKHSEVQDYRYESSACYACHPDA